MQARYYDPVIGRFYSNDPVDVLGHITRENPIHGFNRYAYGNNNPYLYTDPDGQFPKSFAQQLINSSKGPMGGLKSHSVQMKQVGKTGATIARHHVNTYAGVAATAGLLSSARVGLKVASAVGEKVVENVSGLDIAEKADLGVAIMDAVTEVVSAYYGDINNNPNTNGKLGTGGKSGSKSIEQVMSDGEQKKPIKDLKVIAVGKK